MAAGSGIAAGAAAGSAFGPWGTVVGGVLGGVTDIMASGKANAMPAGPSSVTSFTDARFNSSGWVVATGGSSARGELQQSDSGMSPTIAPQSAGSMIGATPAGSGLGGIAGIPWTTILIVAAVVYFLNSK